MKRLGVALVALALAAATAATLLLPLAPALVLGLGGILLARRPAALVLFGASSVTVAAVAFGLLVGTPSAHLGPLRFSAEGAAIGAAGALRLLAVVAVNAGASRIGIVPLLEGARLPPAAEGWLAAVALATHHVRDDAAASLRAQRLSGRRAGPVRQAARLLPAVFLAAVRRAARRAEALRLAGIATGPAFTGLVAVTALAVAGRMAFLAVPNVALTYVVVFLGGILFGPFVGAAAGALAMLGTDLLLTGLAPQGLVNVPAMAAVGALGGWLRGLDWTARGGADRIGLRILAGCIGVAATLLFSVAADLATWALVPEFRAARQSLAALVTLGLAFNIVPAAVNAALFAMATGPTVRAWRAVGMKA